MNGPAASPGDGPDGSAAWLKPPAVLRTLIVGSGCVVRTLARDLRDDERHGLLPVAVLDDTDDADELTHLAHLAHLIAEHAAEAVVLAIPGLPARRFRALADAAVHAGAVVRYLPWFAAALPREATGADLRPLDIRALTGGPEPHTASPEVKEIVTGKRVLVTGAAGPLGSELCRQLHAFDPGALFLLDSDEQALHTLRADVWGEELTADLHDRDETADTFRRIKPEVVFHTAGLRQAPVLERRPSLGVKANILSTDNLVHAAARHGAGRFLHISTDADPASMLGASHRVAEAVVLGATHTAGKKQTKHTKPAKSTTHTAETVFAAVRIGDVLDARGSLLTVLADQIRGGGPVTVTHPNAARSFATVEEAVALALEAGRMATGGELYTLDLGEPALITEVVARFTRQYNLPEVPIRYVGAGLSRSKNPAPAPRIPTAHPQIFALPAATDPAAYAHLPERLNKLYNAAAKNRDPKVRQMLAKSATSMY
jgi:FlaA1/EpsC-like NDP-sugar epimerase